MVITKHKQWNRSLLHHDAAPEKVRRYFDPASWTPFYEEMGICHPNVLTVKPYLYDYKQKHLFDFAITDRSILVSEFIQSHNLNALINILSISFIVVFLFSF